MFNKFGRKSFMVLMLAAVVLGVAGCGSLAEAGGGVAQSSGDNGYTISINGSGIATTTPNVADIQFGVESIHSDAAQAISDNTTKMQAVLAAVKALGVADKDVQTVNYNMWIEQIYNQETGMPTGEMRYHVTNQVSVRLRDITKSGELLGAVLEAGANNVNGITFGVDDPTELQNEARVAAVKNARAKAEALAAGLGVRLGKVRLVSEYTSGSAPIPMYDMAMGKGGEAVSIAGGSYNVTVEVQVTFDIIQ
ncbi:MAG TPA: SIMPL domain-containing protein [Anaerolineae bacterium]|nr:SIMPL domain-containing protein [Anaerolineae bacterium]